MPESVSLELRATLNVERFTAAMQELLDEIDEMCPMCAQKGRAWMAVRMDEWMRLVNERTGMPLKGD